MNRNAIAIVGILAITGALASVLLNLEPPATAATEDHAASEEFERGPHRGRMLRDGDFAVEITIFESGVPPEFHVYPYMNDKPVAPGDVQLQMTLSRLGGVTDNIKFTPKADYLLGDATVYEPHSFDVTVEATGKPGRHRWTYASYEGRTTIDAAAASAAGVTTALAGPSTIRTVAPLVGSIVADPSRRAQVRARFPGVIREVRRSVGDSVKQGEVLVLVESNDSLRSYEVRAPMSGRIVSRNTNVGDVSSDVPLYEIADFSQVFAELTVFQRHIASVREGQPVRINAIDNDLAADAAIAWISPTADAATQSLIARVALPNEDGRWRPGMIIKGEVTTGSRDVPLAVETQGLQAFRDFTVVYAKVGDTYEVRMLDLGASDGEKIEVLGGLSPGTEYVTGNSFLIKADIEKSGASHDH